METTVQSAGVRPGTRVLLAVLYLVAGVFGLGAGFGFGLQVGGGYVLAVVAGLCFAAFCTLMVDAFVDRMRPRQSR